MRADSKLRVGVLLSGSGRTLENLCERAASGALPIELACVIASRADAYGLTRAANHHLPTRVVARRDFADGATFSDATFAVLDEHRVELALLAGYLVKLNVPAAWRGRVMNIHPSLLPSFGGKGFYGDRVHQAVLDAGVKVTGCTVHFVDDEYDCGPIIRQRCVEVKDDDDAHTLAARVFEAEKELYPEAIARYAAGRLSIRDRRVFTDGG